MGGLLNHNYYNVIAWRKNGIRKSLSNILSFNVGLQDYDFLLFLKFDTNSFIPNIDSLIESLQSLYDINQKTFVVLTPRRDAPPYTANEMEYVCSFSCHVDYFKTITAALNNTFISSADLLFALLDQITYDNLGLEKLLVRQFPFDREKEGITDRFDIVISHRGDNEHLNAVLSFLDYHREAKIYLGLDQDVTCDLADLIKVCREISTYKFTLNPVGPYVVRNRLIDQGLSDLIFFQDSDDISCADRFGKISAYMNDTGCQMCGSHELRMDYYSRSVQAVRFPLDVMTALSAGPWHSLHHPTSAITRKAFFQCERLSEERTFGNDTKFLLNSFFLLTDIRNINEFLYIHKKHPGSLTTSPDTMLGSPERRKLLYTWNYDFEQIKCGRLNRVDSSLPFVASSLDFEMLKL